MCLVDSHCHIQSAVFDTDRQTVITRALNELAWLVVVGDNLETSRQAAGLVRDRIYATAGIHPHHAQSADDDVLEGIRRLVQERPGVVAVGEIGLDYHYDHAPRDAQCAAFRRQLALACGLRRPVVIHDRDAHDDIADIVDEFEGRLAGGVMHCFSGDAAFAERCLAWGFYVSFAGNVTFPKAEALREAVLAVPLEKLLIETDSPYLAPQPVRGKRCEPAYIRYTADVLAELKGVSHDVLAVRTSQNAARLFGIPSTPEPPRE